MSLRLSSVLALALPSLAFAAPQDAFEPNDSCATAAAVPLGTTTALTLGPDDDYYAVSALPNQIVTVTATDTGGTLLGVEVYDPGCGSLLVATSNASASVVTCATGDLVVRVPGAAHAALAYELEVGQAPLVDDAAEPNDIASQAIGIGTYSTPDLVVSACSPDWWFYRVAPNSFEIQIDVVSSLGTGNVDLEVYDISGAMIGSSTGPENTEAVRFTNATASPKVIRIKVIEASANYSRYMLTACFTAPNFPSFIGEQVCEAQVNSTGSPATVCAIGSNLVASDDVRLAVFELPMNSFGYFITDRNTGFVVNPGTVMGNLCLAAPGRYSFAIQSSASTSSVFFNTVGSGVGHPLFTLSNTPLAGGGFTAVMPGQRWHWQYWYRDSVGGVATSNFSSAVSVDFL